MRHLHGRRRTSLVCRACLPHLSEYQREKLMRAWHKIIVFRDGSQCVCYGHSAFWDSGELCGNHKETRRVAPEKILDTTNRECVCNGRNAKFSYTAPTAEKKKTAASRAWKPAVCSELGCPLLALKDGKCVRHQP